MVRLATADPVSLFTHILAPTDFSAHGGDAMAYAVGLARDFGTRLTLLHVLESWEDRIPGVRGPELTTEVAEHIRDIFASRGRAMPENNLRQAMVPAGASVIPDQPGTAPGLVCPVGDKVIYAVPGVPYEMHQMMQATILPDLTRRAGFTRVIRSRVLRTWGHSESRLAELLAGRIDELDAIGNPTLAFLASGIEGLKVRITAAGDDEAGAMRLIAEEEPRVRALLGDTVFGIDQQTMESVVLDLLRERGLTLAVAEVWWRRSASPTSWLPAVVTRAQRPPPYSQVASRGSPFSRASATEDSLAPSSGT